MSSESKSALQLKSKVLNQILKESHELGPEMLCVFDLDSTLFDVSPRLKQVLVEYADAILQPTFLADYAKAHPGETPISLSQLTLWSEKLKSSSVHGSDWGIRKAVERAGLMEQAPEFFHHSLRAFWKLHFFHNDFIKYDIPYAGAIAFTNSLYEAGNHIYYLTGRDEVRMGRGTREVLKSEGFPMDDLRAQPALKPESGIVDEDFKADWFDGLKNSYKKIYFFENEPLNIQLVEKKHPAIQIIFFESTHSGKLPAPTHLPIITDYL